MTHFFSRRDSGMTLTETLIAVGIFGFVAMAAANVLVNYRKTNAKVEDIGEIYDLRTFVRNSMSCSETFEQPSAAMACSAPGGNAIDILDHSGSILIAKIEGQTNLFDYKMRAHCVLNNGNYELSFEYLPVIEHGSTNAGKPRKDALTRKEISWKNLTDHIPIVCTGKNFAPDYALCDKLTNKGYANTGICGTNQVMIMLNDGTDPGRSCCPIEAGVLSTIPSEVNIPRLYDCLADEVSTGMINTATPYCTKINTNLLKLSSPNRAIFCNTHSKAPFKNLAAKFHNNDLCACPAGTIIIGGMPSPNNGDPCTLKCAKIEQK